MEVYNFFIKFSVTGYVMITLNDYLYSGDTIFKVLQNYITDLREDARKNKK